jgi:hypothetical protein
MKVNPQLILHSVDKTNDLIFLEKSEYEQKLTELFEDSKKLKKNPKF